MRISYWSSDVCSSDLLLSAVAREDVVVGKRLEPCCFPDRETSALGGVVVDVVVPVLGNVSHHRGGRFVPALHADPILERARFGFPIDMQIDGFGTHLGRDTVQPSAISQYISEHGQTSCRETWCRN